MPDGNKINLTFLDFDVEPGYDYYYKDNDFYYSDYDDNVDSKADHDCRWDYMEMSYGASYKRYCGDLTSSLPGPFITCYNIKVKFSSDEIRNFPGFRAVWSLVKDVGNKF